MAISPVNIGSSIAPRTADPNIPLRAHEAEMKAAEAKVNPVAAVEAGLDRGAAREQTQAETARIEQDTLIKQLVLKRDAENAEFAKKLKNSNINEQLSLLMQNPQLAARKENIDVSRAMLENIRQAGPQYARHIAPLERLLIPDEVQARNLEEIKHNNKIDLAEQTGVVAERKARTRAHNALADSRGAGGVGKDAVEERAKRKEERARKKQASDFIRDPLLQAHGLGKNGTSIQLVPMTEALRGDDDVRSSLGQDVITEEAVFQITKPDGTKAYVPATKERLAGFREFNKVFDKPPAEGKIGKQAVDATDEVIDRPKVTQRTGDPSKPVFVVAPKPLPPKKSTMTIEQYNSLLVTQIKAVERNIEQRTGTPLTPEERGKIADRVEKRLEQQKYNILGSRQDRGIFAF